MQDDDKTLITPPANDSAASTASIAGDSDATLVAVPAQTPVADFDDGATIIAPAPEPAADDDATIIAPAPKLAQTTRPAAQELPDALPPLKQDKLVQARLFGISEPIAGRIIPLRKNNLVAGRSAMADLVLRDDSVSSKHLRFSCKDGHWSIEDLGSSNGTLLNGEEVQRAQLNEGDRLQLGEVELAFNPKADDDLSPSASAASDAPGSLLWVALGGVALVAAATYALLAWL